MRGTFLGVFIKIIIINISRTAIINIFFAFAGGYNKYNYQRYIIISVLKTFGLLLNNFNNFIKRNVCRVVFRGKKIFSLIIRGAESAIFFI